MDHGGKFSDGSDTGVPDFYSDIPLEVENVRNNIGIVDLSNRGKLKLSGKEHLKLLQGMITNDVIKLENKRGLYATSLTPKGKIITDMRVYKSDDYLVVDLEPGINQTYGSHLLKYRLSYKADIEDITDSYSLFHLCGPNSTDFLKNNFNLAEEPKSEFDSVKVNEHGSELFIVKINRTGETGYDLYIDGENSFKIWSKILASGKDINLKPFGLKTLDTLRVEAGIAVLGKDMDETTIPIEAGLWNALDFEKGCYIGQEVVARIKWRGRVNWHLVGLETGVIKNTLKPGSELFIEGKKIGRVTSSVYSPTLKQTIALCYIRREFKEKGVTVDIALPDSLYIKATVTELPFVNNFK